MPLLNMLLLLMGCRRGPGVSRLPDFGVAVCRREPPSTEFPPTTQWSISGDAGSYDSKWEVSTMIEVPGTVSHDVEQLS